MAYFRTNDAAVSRGCSGRRLSCTTLGLFRRNLQEVSAHLSRGYQCSMYWLHSEGTTSTIIFLLLVDSKSTDIFTNLLYHWPTVALFHTIVYTMLTSVAELLLMARFCYAKSHKKPM